MQAWAQEHNPDAVETLESEPPAHDEELPGGGHSTEELITELALIFALIVLVVIAFRPAKRALLGTLDERSARIRRDLEEARRLREEAEATLATFQQKQREAMGEAERIVAHAREDAERLRERGAIELEEALRRREALAMTRIAQAEASALAEVRAQAAEVAVAAARQLIAEGLDRQRGGDLIDAAIRDLPRRLH